MEALYDNLIEYYDEIFPVELEQVSLIKELSKSLDYPRVLYIGSATGSFALALAKEGMDLTGIDQNAAMVQSACRRNPEPRTNARFFCMSMMEIGNSFPQESFDMVLCLANAIVHLDGLESVSAFLRQSRSLIRPGGALLVQFINYDRILNEGMNGLPTIETTRARFEREYRQRDDGRISFESSLFSSSGQLVFRERLALYPLRPLEFVELARSAGFSSVELYDDFTGSPLQGKTLGVLALAKI
ncbi:class I SAM-dependent methyltransferase [Treponema sp.]